MDLDSVIKMLTAIWLSVQIFDKVQKWNDK